MIVSKSPTEYELLPVGVIPAVCVKYYDCGIQRGYQGKLQHKVVLLWELDARRTDGARFLATKSYTASLSDKANLTADLQSWRGRAFTDAELEGFDLDAIVGKPCQLNLVQIAKSNGDPFVEVQTVLRPTKGWVPIVPETAPDFVLPWVATMIANQVEAPAPDITGTTGYQSAAGLQDGERYHARNDEPALDIF
jgi:hypothetical protein